MRERPQLSMACAAFFPASCLSQLLATSTLALTAGYPAMRSARAAHRQHRKRHVPACEAKSGVRVSTAQHHSARAGRPQGCGNWRSGRWEPPGRDGSGSSGQWRWPKGPAAEVRPDGWALLLVLLGNLESLNSLLYHASPKSQRVQKCIKC